MLINIQNSILPVIMKMSVDIQLLQKFASVMSGVFSINDLRNLFNESNDVLLHRRINSLERSGFLSRFKQGFYVTEPYNPLALACRIYPQSYISLGTILAENLLIGSIPAKTVYAVKPGRTKEFKNRDLTLKYLGIQPELIFGIERRNGISRALPEKAFLDTLYFYQKGLHLSFNIYEDIDISKLNCSKILQWLEKYKNPKFRTFVKGILMI